MDLKNARAKAKCNAEEEKDKRAKEEKERFCEELADLRDIFQNNLREDKLKKRVQEKYYNIK